MSNYGMTLEIILAVLLVITILYCWRLDGKLKALRAGQGRLLDSARELQQSVLHAENAVGALRRSADAAGRELQAKIDEARAVALATPPSAPAAAPAPTNVDFTLRRRSVL